MIKTYTKTLFHPELETATFKLFIFDESKYTTEEYAERRMLTGVKSWSIITDEDAKEIEDDIGEPDPAHEYIVLNFANGETATYRNSRVDLFIL